MDNQNALLAKIQKLDALASDRNPNTHEREAARVKARELRKRLNPQVKRFSLEGNIQEMLRRQATSAARGYKDDKEQLIARLKKVIPSLKPSGKLFATELVMEFATKRQLSKPSDWNLVRLLIEEGESMC